MLSRTRPPADIFPAGSILPTTHLRIDIAELRPPEPNPELCARCRDWDVPAFAAGRCGKAHNYLSLEVLRRAAERQPSGCLVCSAVVSAVDARRRECEWLRDIPERCVYVVVQGPFFLDTGSWEDQERRLEVSGTRLSVRLYLELTLCVVPDGSSSERSLPAPLAVTPQFQLTYHAGETTRLQAVEDWVVERFDIATLKKWIDGCEILHGKTCVGEYGSKDDLPSGFRVIDVRRMSVVQPAEPVRFVALSYMWEAVAGSTAQHAQLVAANTSELEAEQSLARVTLPQIILDTIMLCADLGERYLWVDRLCIVQDDERSKPDQIQGMDRIYQSAAFTIMAALNDRKGGGLPGFGDQCRMARASLWGPPRNRNVGHGIDPNGVQTIVDTSLWNRRGWTFQERLLSKRRLFITQHQVLFECRRGQAAEELTWALNRTENARDDAADAYARGQRIPAIPGFYRRSPYRKELSVRLGKQISLADYCHWVEDYTSRQLSHSADILEAFAGVANALRTAMKCGTVFCLPEAFLPQALMWSHTGIATRRDELPWIPSWSWAAWRSAAAGYRWLFDDRRLVDTKPVRIVTLVSSFYYRDPAAAGLRKLNVKERWLALEMDMTSIDCPEKLPPLPRKMGGRMGGGRVDISEETKRMYEEMWHECPHSPWQALAHAELDGKAVALAGDFPGALVFNTTVASLRVGRIHGARSSSGEVMEAEILDGLGRQIGRLDAMDADWIAGRKGKRDRRRLLDFVVVSAALEDIMGERNERVFIERQLHEMWRFNVMLVERLPPDDAFVARRVGVGYVRVSQWKECNPRWETVILR
ncbi:hypothetical protein CPLU01_00987 [Colletotrichum plurivorum]|uniref:Heterokaryon incompatibility domain-containing protein n=1 Tax=Colletotrichum plurivorum TaxID=2175906 RepID=A0A8H6NQB8_9PEZI|nr:hypothetical protein CPLU01_00987 [Colletotrichum plurivorum]